MGCIASEPLFAGAQKGAKNALVEVLFVGVQARTHVKRLHYFLRVSVRPTRPVPYTASRRRLLRRLVPVHGERAISPLSWGRATVLNKNLCSSAFPRCLRANDGVEYDQQFSHARRQSNLWWFADLAQPMIERTNHRVASHG